MAEKINRIFLECSETYIENLNTGIQRVVKNIVKRSEKMSKKYNVPIIPVVLDSKNGYVDLRFFLSQRNGNKNANNNDNNNDNKPQGNKIKKIKEFIKKILKENFKLKETDAIFKFSKFLWILMKKLKYTLIGFRQTIYYSLSPRRSEKTIFPQEGDLLILLDGFWGYRYNNYFTYFCRRFKQKGGMIIAVIYDIIPLTNPEFFEKELVKRFKKKIYAFKNLVDVIMTISKNEAENIKNYLKDNLKIQNKKVLYFELGTDFIDKCLDESFYNGESSNLESSNLIKHVKLVKHENDAVIIRNDLINLIKLKELKELKELKAAKTSNLYLMVGTIEPRKGHNYTLEAFEELWNGGFNGLLVISGRIGWKIEDLLKKIESSPYLGKNLFVFNDLSDEELDFLYKNSDAVICASKREGFSLPLVEAAFCGKKVFASDIPIFREIGEKYPVFSYFKAQKSGLIQAVKQFENTRKGKGKVFSRFDFNSAADSGTNADINAEINADYVTWEQSVDTFFSKIFAL